MRRHRSRHSNKDRSKSKNVAVAGVSDLTVNIGVYIMNVTGTFTWPTSRKTGAALALSEIASATLTRNGSTIQTLTPTGPTASFSDTGSAGDAYNVTISTTDGSVSDPSNTATLAGSGTGNPATAVTDLAVTGDGTTSRVHR